MTKMTKMRSTAAAAVAAASVAAVSSSNRVDAFVPSCHRGHLSKTHDASAQNSKWTSSPTTSTCLFAGPAKKQPNNKKSRKSNQSKKVGKRRFAQNIPQSSYETNNYDDDGDDVAVPRDVLQTSKSIEELESIMSQRWGTTGDQWSADFDEEELVYDDDGGGSDDNNGVNESRLDLGRSAAANNVGGKKFKAKPVLDPWQKAEAERQKAKEKDSIKADKSKHQSTDSDQGGSFFGGGGEDAVLDRVRRNQEKLKEKREAKMAANAPKKNKKEKNMEFYDEDDQGYESISAEEDDDEVGVAFDSIIAPEPAAPARKKKKSSSSANINEEETGGASSGFFFRQTSETTDASNDSSAVNVEESKPNDRKKKDAEPKLSTRKDDNGNAICLTLDQAEKNVEQYLASLSASDVSAAQVTDEDDPLAVSDWEDLGVANPLLLKNLRQRMRCPQPLSVQDKACPPILSGSDVLVSTHTGSGKTLAFLAPLAQRLLIDAAAGDVDQGVKVVIVAPGRELASQIVSVARDLLEGTGLKVLLTIGGTPFSRSVDAIRKKKPDIVIGTPGRIAELIVGQPGAKSGRMKLNSLQTIVLDEFDALLEYEPHRDPTRATMRAVKRRHGDALQSVLCSATAADMMGKDLLEEMLRPGFAHAQVDEGDRLITTAQTKEGGADTSTRVSRTAIHGSIAIPDKRLKLETLRRVLYTEPTPQQVLIFVDNSRRVGIVVDKLAQMGIVAAPLHGGYGSEKNDRAEVSRALREGFVGIVVATELAARGIDAPYLTHVINLDLPTDASHYAHRAGRCGRGGRPGVVVNIAAGPKEKRVPDKFADALGIEMNTVEPRAGKLVLLEDGLD